MAKTEEKIRGRVGNTVFTGWERKLVYGVLLQIMRIRGHVNNNVVVHAYGWRPVFINIWRERF